MTAAVTVPTATDSSPATLNGEPVPAGLTLAALLEQRGVSPNAVATAINGQFVARSAREQRVLQPGDQVTTFAAIVGG